MIDIKEIYWAAGFYEGEGSCRYRKGMGVEIKVTQSDQEPLQRLAGIFGGRIKADNMTASRKQFPNARQRYNWVMSGNRALGILMTIYFLLSERRKQQIKAVIDGVKAAPVRRWEKAPYPDYKNWLYANDEDWREAKKAHIREKYQNDAEFRESVKQRAREWEKEQRADPEKLAMLRRRRNAYQRQYRAKLKSGG